MAERADTGPDVGAGDADVLQRLLDTSSDFIARVALDGTVLFASSSCELLLGYTPEELVGRNAYELYHPDDIAALEAGRDEVVAIPDIVTSTYRIRRKDGTYIWFESTGYVLRDRDTGAPIELNSVSRDVTDRILQEQERENLLRMLEDSNEELERFASSVAHDLKGPLSFLSAMTQTLPNLLGPGNDQIDDALSRMHRQSMSCIELIDGLLGYAKLSGMADRVAVRLDDDVVAFVTDTLSSSIEETDTQISYSELPTVLGNAAGLRQLFQNLVSNSIRYRRPDRPPRITIDATRSGATWTIRCTDNGRGIDPARGASIFDLGAIGVADSDGDVGTGLGLAACKLVAIRHGGHIWVDEPPPEGGTTFLVELPAAGPEIPRDAGPVTVFLVEDEATEADVLIEQLAGHGISVVGTAADPIDARRRYMALPETPTVVVTDMRLGLHEGTEFIEFLRSNHPGQPVVIHSGHIDGAVTRRAAELGVVACIEKSRPERLIELLTASS